CLAPPASSQTHPSPTRRSSDLSATRKMRRFAAAVPTTPIVTSRRPSLWTAGSTPLAHIREDSPPAMLSDTRPLPRCVLIANIVMPLGRSGLLGDSVQLRYGPNHLAYRAGDRVRELVVPQTCLLGQPHGVTRDELSHGAVRRGELLPEALRESASAIEDRTIAVEWNVAGRCFHPFGFQRIDGRITQSLPSKLRDPHQIEVTTVRCQVRVRSGEV